MKRGNLASIEFPAPLKLEHHDSLRAIEEKIASEKNLAYSYYAMGPVEPANKKLFTKIDCRNQQRHSRVLFRDKKR